MVINEILLKKKTNFVSYTLFLLQIFCHTYLSRHVKLFYSFAIILTITVYLSTGILMEFMSHSHAENRNWQKDFCRITQELYKKTQQKGLTARLGNICIYISRHSKYIYIFLGEQQIGWPFQIKFLWVCRHKLIISRIVSGYFFVCENYVGVLL